MDTPPGGSWFDPVADVYDRARPAYPEPLFDDLFASLPSPQGGRPLRVLEIGPGTGQATRPLLERGAEVIAVEPGATLAALLATKFEGHPRLRVLNARFEDVDLPAGAFDLLLAATSFHWVDPQVRVAKSHALLADGGALALIGTNQVASPADRGFFDRCQPIYRRYRPEEAPPPLPGEDVVPPEHEEVVASGLFAPVRLSRYRWDQRYSTAQYADLVRSYSNTQQMPPGPREALIRDLGALIDAEFDGYVVRPLVITLVLARKRER